MPPLPPLLDPDEIGARLKIIFLHGVEERAFLVRDMAARTVFVALYIGSVEGADRWLAPRHVLRMGDSQAARPASADRLQYYELMNGTPAPSATDRWYADNTREPLRDEVIRQGLVPVNAMVENTSIPTTSPRGRYALQREFAALFSPTLSGHAFAEAAAGWGKLYLAPAALARAQMLRASASTSGASISVSLPKGPTILLPPGPSPTITKAVIEVFAPAFLGDPRVAWVSDSASKVPFKDAPLESALKIALNSQSLLPDAVLVDLAPPGRPGQVLFVFVEVVASDGPVTEQRKTALLGLLASSSRKYRASDAAFVTAYTDKRSDAARRTIMSLAWGSFAWFMSEPDRLFQFHHFYAAKKLSELL